MKNTPQLIGVRALLTFVFFAWTPQQMFAHHYLVSPDPRINRHHEAYAWKAVIITELMADPSPPQGLPEVEFIELYNRTSSPILLEGWHISDPTRTTTLTNVSLAAHEYLVVTSKPAGFANNNLLVVPNLPSLNNDGDSLLLSDPLGNLVDIVSYSVDWYRDARRSEGGWSLELIDVDNTCEEMENWGVSESATGGTPGQQNAIAASNPDVAPPEVLSAYPLSESTLRVSFSERLTTDALTAAHWVLSPAVDVIAASFADGSFSKVDLQFGQPLSGGMLYGLTLFDIVSCAGNVLNESRVIRFALPEDAQRGDVAINEIMFNPPPDGVDFVELFNASGKYLELNGWAIGTIDRDGGWVKSVIHEPIVLAPGRYLAFTSDIAKLQSHYATADTTVYELKIPNYPDDHGVIVLLNMADSVIDQFEYDASFHNIFVRDPEAVSLERISPYGPTGQSSNWTSASSSVGFATPGRPNSVLSSISF